MTVATLDQFIQDLQSLLQAAWGDGWGQLLEELPARETSEELQMPIILVELISRKPSEDLRGIKPRLMSTYLDEVRSGLVDEHRMWFDVEIQFCCYHTTHQGAKDLAEGLEEILMVFAGHFKSRGIEEILFLEETAPRTNDERRLPFPGRHLRYKLRMARVYRFHSSVIQDISAKVGIKNPQ